MPAIPIWLPVAWSYAKRYAWLAFAVLSAVLAYVLLRRPDPGDLAKQLEEVNRLHDEELKRIQDAQAEHDRQRDEDQRKLEDALAKLDESHRQAIAALDDEKRKQVEQLLKEHGDDPAALADLLAKELGLQVR